MKSLEGTETEKNLKSAFAREAQANRRYKYFAIKADLAGYADIAAVFRSMAEGEAVHAQGFLMFLEKIGDPVTGLPIGPAVDNLKAAIAAEAHECSVLYPAMARTARAEGLNEIADWFDTLTKAERSHATRFKKALDALER